MIIIIITMYAVYKAIDWGIRKRDISSTSMYNKADKPRGRAPNSCGYNIQSA